jgi:DNA-binding PadR family transcriptional regulator
MANQVNLSDKEFIILGMLSKKPMYGYEIDKEIRDTSMREWTDLAFSSIYYILKKLEKKNFISSESMKNEKNQIKKIYTITTIGKNGTQIYLKSLFQEYSIPKWRIDLGLAYASLLDKTELGVVLKSYSKAIEKTIRGYQNLKKYLLKDGCTSHRLQLAERPIILLSAELEWLQMYQKKI